MIGIDPVAVVLVVIAFVVAQIRSLSLRLRYSVMAICLGLIAVLRLRGGARGSNLIFVALAGGFAVYYAIRAMRAGPR